VVGNADPVRPDGDATVNRPAAVSLMRSDGFVDLGVVDTTLLREQPRAPFGIASDPDRVVAAALDALAEADVVVVDNGDLDRLRAYDSVMTPTEREELRATTLRQVDATVGALAEQLGDDVLLLVVGVRPPTAVWELTPVVAAGAGVQHGRLYSPSTQRSGLITLTDLAPTILDVLGVPVPTGMIGAPLRYEPGEAALGALQSLNDTAGGREDIYYPIALTFIIVQAIGYALVVMSLRIAPDIGRHLLVPARILVLTFASWPLATYLLRIAPGIYRLEGGTHVLLWIVASLIACLAYRLTRRTLAPLVAICAATVGLLLVDLAVGAPLQMSSLLGYSPHTAARFTGFGNTTFAVFGACAVVVAALHVHHAPRRREALVGAAALLGVVLVADVAPQLGADVGGVLTFVPVFGLALWALSGRKLSFRVVVLLGLATLLVLAVVVGVDLLRDPADRSHLGRFVLASGEDSANFWSTINRKWATNMRVLSQTIWAWMVPIVAVFALYVLVVARGWRRLLPVGSPLRVAVIGTLGTGVVGWLTNDSGVVIAALAFVYIGPLLTLLALSPEQAPPILRGPAAVPERASPPA
jgi:hypothetical protein